MDDISNADSHNDNVTKEEKLKNSDSSIEDGGDKSGPSMVSFRPKGPESEDLDYAMQSTGLSKSRVIGEAITEMAHRRRLLNKERDKLRDEMKR